MRADQPQTERLSEGTIIGPYAVSRFVRQGGMASIYFGRHVSTDAKVAIKVISLACADEPILRARFERESELMGRMIGVRNVAKVLDSGELDDGRLYLVMEWVEGNDLDELLEQARDQDQRLDAWTATRYALGIARGLEALHLRDVVHRDLKPGNIMIERVEGRDLTAKIVDFGISADLAPVPSYDDLTGSRGLGTDSYTSPEQALGKPPDPAMDIWSFGAVLMELYGSVRIPSTLRTEGIPLEFNVAGPREIRPKIMRLIRGCLAKDSASRPTAEKVRLYLETITKRLEALEAPPPTPSSMRPREMAPQEPEPAAATSEDSGYFSAMLEVDAGAKPEPERDRTLIRAPPPFAAGSEIDPDILYPVPHGGTEPASSVAAMDVEDPGTAEAPTIVRTGATQPHHDAAAPTVDRPRPVADSAGLPVALWIVWGAAAALLLVLVGWSVLRTPGANPEISVASVERASSPERASGEVAASRPTPTRPTPTRVAPTPVAPTRVDPLRGASAASVASPRLGETALGEARTSGPSDGADAAAAETLETPALGASESDSPDENEAAVVGTPASGRDSTPDREDSSSSEQVARIRPPVQRRVPAHTTAACSARRDRAEEALSRRAWIDVLTETKTAQCWSSPTPRRLMRVKALLELGWFEQCVDEGQGDDARLRPMVATCRKLLGP